MLLGFISLLLTVFQNLISKICIPSHVANDMLPCKRPTSEDSHHGRRLLSEGGLGHCEKGKVQMLSLEALHHLHIFIFVLAVVHVVFCVTTMILGGAKISHWKQWEDSIRRDIKASQNLRTDVDKTQAKHHREFLENASGYWNRVAIVSWILVPMAFRCDLSSNEYGWMALILLVIIFAIDLLLFKCSAVTAHYLCTHSLLRLVARMQMGSMFKEGMLGEHEGTIKGWIEGVKSGRENMPNNSRRTEIQKMDTELSEIVQITEHESAEILQIAEQSTAVDEEGTSKTYMTELSHKSKPPFSSS
uniref:MLO-like protein n=1 Tax=Cannabis sativa TaxID=3483 RepID=A0A803PIP8_CANSA